MSPDERLDRIESRTAIADIVHAYARAVRHGRVDEAVDLFTKDGWFETREGPSGGETTLRMRVEGRDHYRVFLASTMPEGKPLVSPLIHNLSIEFDTADEARGNAMLETIVLPTGQRTVGEYHDHYRRENGRWLFAGRTFTIQISG